MTGSTLPHPVEELRTRVQVGAAYNTSTNAVKYSGAFAAEGFDNSFDIDAWKKNFKINILTASEEEIVFDLIGVDASVANALRRVLLSEVPTMAIEKVMMADNTSIVQDEVMAHRLGLIPIMADPDLFQYTTGDEEDRHDHNHLVFTLEARCFKNKETGQLENETVTSGQLVWQPVGQQEEMFKDNPPRPVHADIVITKLRPGQRVEMKLICEKGTGYVHAKWSPVSTAFYRLLPEIKFTKPVTGALATELKEACPMNVFDIEDIAGVPTATTKRPRNCSVCRECVRRPAFQPHVKLNRVRDHFIFTVESTGITRPEKLVREALKIFIDKCGKVKKQLQDEVAAAANQ
eukprot:GFYU01003263.1.p1 GENE.GFYU01003263.1~~GFYU01003263.1.p1  ORF type:complete len:348 (-),score=114.09 GFYU01003263.1:194-1237(-)